MNIKNLINKLPINHYGKVAVARLIEKITPENTVGIPKQGEVWLTENGRIGIINNEIELTQIDEIFPYGNSGTVSINSNIKIGLTTTKVNENLFSSYYFRKLADSPLLYFKSRAKILRELRVEFPA